MKMTGKRTMGEIQHEENDRLKKKKGFTNDLTDEVIEQKKELLDDKRNLKEGDCFDSDAKHVIGEQLMDKQNTAEFITETKDGNLDDSLNDEKVKQEVEEKEVITDEEKGQRKDKEREERKEKEKDEEKNQEKDHTTDTAEKKETEVEKTINKTEKEEEEEKEEKEDTTQVKDKDIDKSEHTNDKISTNTTEIIKENKKTKENDNTEDEYVNNACGEVKETPNVKNELAKNEKHISKKTKKNSSESEVEKLEIPEEKKNDEKEKKETKEENDKTKNTEEIESKKENIWEEKEVEEHEAEKEGDKMKAKEKKEEKKEETNDVKKEEIKGFQEGETLQKKNNDPSTNDATKGQYNMYGATTADNQMYTSPMDNSYLNYSTNYLEQYYNSTAHCYSDISKGSVYNAYHNQQNVNANNNSTTMVAPMTSTTNMNSNVSELKKGKKLGYAAKGSYETEYKMEDKNGNYGKMPNMYLNSHMNPVASGPMPNHHMVNPMGAGTMGSHMNYLVSAVTPHPTAPATTASMPVSVPGSTPNAAATAVPVAGSTMDNHYMYNYSYMNNPNCSNYYYMYDPKGYEYQTTEAESEQPYDFSAVIDKSLEMMKRNNKVKEILKRPARLQITPEELNKYEYSEGGDSYNIWFGKYVTDRYDKSAKNIPRFVAKYKCNPQKDSGYTKADRVYNSKQFFCIYFARGCCAYGSNCLYKHRVPTENDELEFEHTIDIFGREKFSTYKDDMSGVGCFNSDCRTLFIGSVFINNFNDAPKVEKMLYDEFSNFGNVDYVRYIPNKNIAFVQYSNRVNAEFAKVAMSDQPLENHSTALTIKWAYEFKHPPTSYPHYYNAPYMYNQSQLVSPAWGNYLMQQQYCGAATSNHMAAHMNGHLPSYHNGTSATTQYTDYANMYSAQHKKNERPVPPHKQQFTPN